MCHNVFFYCFVVSFASSFNNLAVLGLCLQHISHCSQCVIILLNHKALICTMYIYSIYNNTSIE